MKIVTRVLVVSLLMINAVTVIAQNSIDYQSEFERYLKMQRTGKTLAIVGASGIVVSGAWFLCVRHNILENWSFDDLFLESRGLGLVGSMVLGGISTVVCVSGLIVNSKGKRKSAEYQSKIDNLKIVLYYTPNHAGIALTYRF